MCRLICSSCSLQVVSELHVLSTMYAGMAVMPASSALQATGHTRAAAYHNTSR
jgi:hypothetical protein